MGVDARIEVSALRVPTNDIVKFVGRKNVPACPGFTQALTPLLMKQPESKRGRFCGLSANRFIRNRYLQVPDNVASRCGQHAYGVLKKSVEHAPICVNVCELRKRVQQHNQSIVKYLFYTPAYSSELVVLG